MTISAASIASFAISEPTDAEELIVPTVTNLLAHSPTLIIADNLYRADYGENFAGDPIVTVLERVGVSVVGTDRSGNPISDPARVKLLKEVWPVFRGPEGTIIDCYFSAVMRSGDAISWQGPFSFTIGQTTSVRPLVEGAYLGWRFISVEQPQWFLLSMLLDIEPTGEVYS